MVNGEGVFTMNDKWGNPLVEVPCRICGAIKIQRRSTAKRQINPLCRSCGGREGMRKRGRFGRKIDKLSGYVLVVVHPDDPLRVMAHKSGWCLEHRLVMARFLGRPLLASEFVHHKNGIKTDNRIENLELISRGNHAILNKLCAHCELRKEVRLLNWRIKELENQVREMNLNKLGL
jgi:hypothetical protein